MKTVPAIPEQKIRQLHYRSIETGETVHSVDVPNPYFWRRIKAGMEINMREDLYVDGSEFADVTAWERSPEANRSRFFRR